MGYLFENMEKMDIQAERRNTAQARAEAEAAKERARVAEQRAETVRQRAEAAEQKLISLVERKLEKGQTEEQIAEDLLEPVSCIRELRDKIK